MTFVLELRSAASSRIDDPLAVEIEPFPHKTERVPQNMVDLDGIAVAPLYARFSGLERDCKRGGGAFHGRRPTDPLTVAAEFQISDPLSIKALAADMCGVDSVRRQGCRSCRRIAA